ncbi:hypothetical protein LTS10_011012 [Elasticomyces elasticus]|nr:hypothetical protein LTS10_011012 [Elasticomyces elasticus]
MAWTTKHVVRQLVEALRWQHVPECYTERFEVERKTGLGYRTLGEDIIMGDDVDEYPANAAPGFVRSHETRPGWCYIAMSPSTSRQPREMPGTLLGGWLKRCIGSLCLNGRGRVCSEDGEQQGPDELEGLGEPALTDEELTIVLEHQAEGGEGEVKCYATEWESAKVLAAQAEKDARATEQRISCTCKQSMRLIGLPNFRSESAA